jgi:hypothetical protein
MSELDKWDSFYVIIGSAAGALIGLQFVVITLMADKPLRSAQAGRAFATPTIVHFSVVLLLSALLRAPWDTMNCATLLCSLVGLGGTAYALVTAWRMRVQTAYTPDLEDWLFHIVAPLAAYATLAACAFVDLSHAKELLFAVGGAALLLLFCGIHNAWDAAAFNVLVQRKQPGGDKP